MHYRAETLENRRRSPLLSRGDEYAGGWSIRPNRNNSAGYPKSLQRSYKLSHKVALPALLGLADRTVRRSLKWPPAAAIDWLMAALPAPCGLLPRAGPPRDRTPTDVRLVTYHSIAYRRWLGARQTARQSGRPGVVCSDVRPSPNQLCIETNSVRVDGLPR